MTNGWSIGSDYYSEVYYTGKNAREIAKESGVTFAEGSLEKIQAYRDYDGFGVLANPDDVKFKAILKDGTQIDYRRQMPTNKSKVSIFDNKVYIEGIQDMYVSKHSDYANIPKRTTGANYELYGCKGFVNVEDNNNDKVMTHDRLMPDGNVQKSYLYICHDDSDNVKMRKNDVRYEGN